MVSIINGTSKNPVASSTLYNYLFTELADPRTNSWFLISDPGPPLQILIIWMYFVLNIGPKLMRDRKPFELRNVLIVYNLLQVIISSYIFIRGGQVAWFSKYNWRCQPVPYSPAPDVIETMNLVYLYFLNKMMELLDTVFFVLRKKNKQITFLHVYHHTVMPMVSWACTKYYPGGHGTFVGFVNSFVHIIMYSYYLLAAFGPKVQKYLWWKKYITTLQLGQFCIVFIHNSQLLFNDCGFPRYTVIFTMPNAVFFYYLFFHFYKEAYDISKQNPTALTHQQNNNLTVKDDKEH